MNSENIFCGVVFRTMYALGIVVLAANADGLVQRSEMAVFGAFVFVVIGSMFGWGEAIK